MSGPPPIQASRVRPEDMQVSKPQQVQRQPESNPAEIGNSLASGNVGSTQPSTSTPGQGTSGPREGAAVTANNSAQTVNPIQQAQQGRRLDLTG